ncbi:MAG: M48 family metallopeptidase [Desulfobacterales bacterium]|nr:M48 family metallopeptidase [Desulfobacterales bacterium]
MNWIGWVVLVVMLAEAGLRVAADLLNLRHCDGKVPRELADVYDPKRYAEAQAYLRARTRFGWVATGTHLTLVVGFWLFGGFSWLDIWTRGLGLGPIFTGLLYIGVLLLARWLTGLPLDLYATFVIETRFGFNRTTAGVFVSDLAKKMGLALLLGGPLVAGVLAFFLYAGPRGWWICWLLVTGFTLGVQYVAPTWILPLFNRFTPLADGPLREAIVAYAAGIDFPLDNVMVMDGSRRSSRSNAFFTGFGRHRRIALFDTLVQRHSVAELVGVLAHEMGHYKLRHIGVMTVLSILQVGLMLFVLSFFLSWQPLFDAFFVQSLSVHAGLVFFALLYTPVDLLLGLFLQRQSRKNEMAADRFAAETTAAPEALGLALKKLSVDNLTPLNPHPFYVWLNHSHPPILERIRALGAETPSAA